MNVVEIMSREVACCGPEDTLNRAAQLMWEHDCGCVPVVEDGGTVVGMLTDRDACMAAYTRGTRLDDIRVRDVMSRDVKCCQSRDAVEAVERSLRDNQIRRMPVLEGRRLVGIVSLNDLALAAERGQGKQGFPTPNEVASTLAGISHHRPSIQARPS